MEQRELVLAHSPDADDAFMFYALATRKLRPPRLSFRHVLLDIETLNRQAMEAKFDLTAISFHAYPYVAERYRLLSTGSSMGDGYGPLLVSPRLLSVEQLPAIATLPAMPPAPGHWPTFAWHGSV